MENYKVKVGSEAESKEAQELFFELGYEWLSGAESPINLGLPYLYTNEYMVLWCGGWHSTFNECGKKKLTIPQLRDLVVLKRNDIADATHSTESCGAKGFLSSDGVEYFWEYGVNVWSKHGQSNFAEYEMKPITKEPAMKEYLNKLEDGTYKLVVLDSVADGVEGLIEIPEGADTLAGDSSTRYFWKHGVGEKGNMIIGVGESLARYSGWTDCKDSADVWLDCVNDDSFKIIWQRETLNDKVASAEVARQEFIGDQPTAFDTQISGDHYKLLPVQPMKFALANGLDYAQGNVIKYVIRHASKGGKDDLLKAIHNIELMIEHYYG